MEGGGLKVRAPRQHAWICAEATESASTATKVRIMAAEISSEKAAAIMAALLEGQGVNAIARTHDVSAGYVSRLKKNLDPAKVAQAAARKDDDLHDLVFDVLRTGLLAQSVIVTAASDPVYIRQQNAADVAVLYGVISDKSVRLLEACAGDPEAGAGEGSTGE